MAHRLSLLKDLHANLKASTAPSRATDARIFQLFDREAQIDLWPQRIENQIAGEEDHKDIKLFTLSVDAALSIWGDRDDASILREVLRDFEWLDRAKGPASIPHFARAIVSKNIEHTILQMTLTSDVAAHDFIPGLLVKLTMGVTAEGVALPAGTLMKIEHAYEDSIDLVHSATGTLLWVRPNQIEELGADSDLSRPR